MALAEATVQQRVAYSATERGKGRVIPLWDDSVRTAQRARLSAENLRWQLHEVQAASIELRAKLKDVVKAWPADARRAIPVPSRHVLQTVLGFFRTCASFSVDPIERIELSNEELAGRLGLSLDCVKRALAFLGSHGVWHAGEKLYDGLGWLNRFRRVDPAVVDGQLAPRNRTAVTYLTAMGKAALALFKDLKQTISKAAQDEKDQRRGFKERWRAFREKTRREKEAKRSAVDQQELERQRHEHDLKASQDAREWCNEQGVDASAPAAFFASMGRMLGVRKDPDTG